MYQWMCDSHYLKCIYVSAKARIHATLAHDHFGHLKKSTKKSQNKNVATQAIIFFETQNANSQYRENECPQESTEIIEILT